MRTPSSNPNTGSNRPEVKIHKHGPGLPTVYTTEVPRQRVAGGTLPEVVPGAEPLGAVNTNRRTGTLVLDKVYGQTSDLQLFNRNLNGT